jgi:hypothetical protein
MPDSPTGVVQQRIIVPFEGHIIGQGVNSDTCERVGTGLKAGSEGEDQQADGQNATFKFQVITDQQSLESALNISADVEARYALLSGGAKFGFAEKNAVNSSSTYVLASCVCYNSLRSGRDFTPTDNAAALLKTGDQNAFKTAFGDRFCEALHTGGEFQALVRVTSSNTAHQSDISASLHGELNGLAASGSFKAAFDLAQKDTAAHTEVDIEIFQVGGQGAQIKMPGADADKIRDIMNGFASVAHDHPQAFEAELVTYDTLALPGPSAMEQEDRRKVLEDCQTRKQKYWSAISQLDFLQTDDAQKIFADLPGNSALENLENEFRRVLGDLMTYARGVSAGTIPANPFVPVNEPVLPVYTRVASTLFSQWWLKRNDADLLVDEQTLIHRIGQAAARLLVVPVETATPDAMQKAVNQLDTVDLSYISGTRLGSVAELPGMLTPSLQTLNVTGNALTTLTGLEPFVRLQSLTADRNQLTDISVLAKLPGLKLLQLRRNRIVDLSAIAGMTSLETLGLDGNQISTLDPLGKLQQLSLLILSASTEQSASPAQPNPPNLITTNPVADGRALSQLPKLGNVFINSDSIAITLTPLPAVSAADWSVLDHIAAGETVPGKITGVATREGTSTRFKFTPSVGSTERLTFAGVFVSKGLDAKIWVAVLLDDRQKMGLAVFDVDPTARKQSLSAIDFAKYLAPPNRMQLFAPTVIGFSPDFMMEAKPA